MQMNKCPVPGCGHLLDILTHNHCMTTHGMSKNDVIKQFGKPQIIKPDYILRTKNLKMQVNVTKNSFWNIFH